MVTAGTLEGSPDKCGDQLGDGSSRSRGHHSSSSLLCPQLPSTGLKMIVSTDQQAFSVTIMVKVSREQGSGDSRCTDSEMAGS